MRLNSVSYKDVAIDDGFWSARLETNRKATLLHGFNMLREHGYEENFIRAGQRLDGGFQGLVYQDSDVYKLLEGAAASLAKHPDDDIQGKFDHWVSLIETAQEEDGYLNTHFQLKAPEKKWANLRDWHELYCAGHLIEAAVCDYLGKGGERLLRVAVKLANHICNRFGPGNHEGYPGHPELELALIRLSSVTGERRYYELARHFVRSRGTHYFAREHGTSEEEYDGAYWQDRVPISELDVIEGHAVRAVYLLCAATDIVRETGDEDLETTVQRVWDNVVSKRMYVTGGIGNSAKNEGFTTDYDLPNETAYQETCASIAMIFWGHRLATLYGKSAYADYMEKALYNGVLAGVSLDGTKFFYENPLSSDGSHQRKDWYACACCPPNISRFLSTLGDYIYATSSDALYVNLFVSGSAQVEIGGEHFKIEVRTDYPWDGRIVLIPKGPSDVSVRVRIPDWCDHYDVYLDGEPTEVSMADGYASVDGDWDGVKQIEIVLQMPIRHVRSHPSITGNAGHIAIARGPVVYCFEQCDNPESLEGLYLDEHARSTSVVCRDDTIVIAEMSAQVSLPWNHGLYGPEPETRAVTAKAVPYFFWNNRKPGGMKVWIPTYAPGFLSD